MASMFDFMVLPEGCIANILSFTTPRDACRLSLVSKIFRSAAESDAMWERFLPSDYHSIISRSSPSLLDSYSSKKDLFFRLCDNPIILDDGKKSLQLDKWNGTKCYMLAANDLFIVWGEDSRYWVWQPLPESRFAEVAMLAHVCWLEIRGKIKISMLSSATRYGVYLVLKMIDAYGFNYHAAEVSVGTVGGVSFTKSVCLDPDIENRVISSAVDSENLVELERPKERSDGWLEIELGEFLSLGQEDDELEMCLKEVEGGNWKSGLTVQGIEIRPKEEN